MIVERLSSCFFLKFIFLYEFPYSILRKIRFEINVSLYLTDLAKRQMLFLEDDNADKKGYLKALRMYYPSVPADI